MTSPEIKARLAPCGLDCGKCFACDHTNFDPHLETRWVAMNRRMKEIGVEAYIEETRDNCRYV